MREAIQRLLQQAIAQHQAGQLEDALAVYEVILEREADQPDALNLSGAALVALQRPAEAVQRLVRANSLLPGRPDILSNLGAAHEAAGAPEQAQAVWEEGLRLAPNHAGLSYNLGLLAAKAGDPARAVPLFQSVLSHHPEHAACWEDLGGALVLIARYEEALPALQRAYGLGRRTPGLALKLALSLQETGDREGAYATFTAGLTMWPEDADLLSWALKPFADQWRLDMFDAHLPTARRLADEEGSGVPIQPLLAIATGEPLDRLTRLAQRRGALHGVPAPVIRPRARSKDRLVIGYLSSDFHDHATMHLMAGVFRHHDRELFEIRCYAEDGDNGDAYRSALKRQTDAMVEIRGLTGKVAAERIAADGVDILVDLKGYTQDARLDVAAYRPAPVQMHYLGYPGTLAVPWIDYYIGDSVTIPPEGRAEFREAVIRLPNCYQCTDDQRPISADPGTRTQWGLPEDGFVFAAFNALYKIRPETFDLWMELLCDVPGSVLWLFAPEGGVRDRLAAHARRCGVAANRLVFASRVTPDRHLARLVHADLALDCWPYGAHTTAADLMWAGVPLLTLKGDRFAARVAASILTACGAAEGLVVETPAAYKDRAVQLAHDPAELDHARAAARRARTSPHFDSEQKTRDLEAAYLAAWRRFEDGQAPADITL